MTEIMSYKDVYDYHGWRVQNKQLLEEAGELIEAIHDYNSGYIYSTNDEVNKKCKDIDRQHIIEEIADVTFLLNQVKEFNNISDYDVEIILDIKRKRESKRIADGYYID